MGQDNVRYGATPEAWAHFDMALGLGEDLLPVVSNPGAAIDPTSKLKGLGKTPSRYTLRREVVGVGKWTAMRATPAQLDHWSTEPDYGICVQTRRVRALDIDVPEAEAANAVAQAFEEMLDRRALPWRVRSNSGKRLGIFIVGGDDLGKRSFKTATGLVEFLATGQQFIAVGQHTSGVPYEWLGGLPDDVPVISSEAFEAAWAKIVELYAVEAPRSSGAAADRSRPDLNVEDDVASYLVEHWETYGVDRGKLFVACPWKDGHSSDSGETEAAWLLAGTRGFAQGHFECLHASCNGRRDDEFLDAVGYRAAQFEALRAELDEDDGLVAAYQGTGARLPLPGFIRDNGGRIENTVENVRRALSVPEAIGYDIRHDGFKGEVVWTPPGVVQWRPLRDTDYFEIRVRLEGIGFKPVGKEMVRDAVYHRAESAAIDTAQVWLAGLTWDGVARVEGFFARYFGTKDTAYTRAVSRYVWTALAGRVLLPGCKVDMVPALVGDQGMGKSTGIEAIAPGEGHFDEFDLTTIDTDNTRRKFRGKLVGELAELKGLHSRDSESIKAWITRRIETWTPKYQEHETSYPRRLVLFATSNLPEILSDETGSRRWLPMDSGTVDVAAIRADRDQLWAEAAVRYRAGGVDYAEAETLARGEHEAFRVRDESWEGAISRWLVDEDLCGDAPSKREYLTTSEILGGAIGLDPKSAKRADEMRVGRCMRNFAYSRGYAWIDGRNVRVWRLNVQ